MKKYLNIIILVFLTIFLTSCFGKTSPQNDIDSIKDDLLNSNSNSGQNQNNNNLDIPKYESVQNTNTGSENTTNTNNTTQNNTSSDKYSVRYFGDNNFIEINDLSKQDFANRKVEITGKTFVNVDKILVSFSNPTSSFPNDNRYQLTQFKSGDKTFLYRAFSQYNTLDYGTNEYLIEAYSGENVSKVEIIINVPNKEDSNSNNSNNSNNTSSNTNTSNIVSENYDITGLVITQLKPDLSVTTSDELNNFLTDNAGVKTWFYWNSLRPIQNGVGVSFYTIMLNVENYTYSKHYYIPDGTYGVLLLDTGTGIDKENIADKNAEFKDKNSDFDTTKADEYFKGLLNS